MKLNRGDIVIANLESVSKGSIQKYGAYQKEAFRSIKT